MKGIEMHYDHHLQCYLEAFKVYADDGFGNLVHINGDAFINWFDFNNFEGF